MNKQISTTMGILITVLVAGVAGASVLFMSQEKKGNDVEIEEEDIFINSKNIINCEEEFDFIYSFGVGTSILNTKDNIYSPDMCGESPVDYEMIFTENEKKEICSFVKENDLMLIKNEFIDNCDITEDMCVTVSPLYRSSLEIFSGKEKIKKIVYLDHYYNQDDPQLEIFKNVMKIIEEFISRKVKELDIYQPMCGYM
jgi:hypothetical protein